jgi:pSer/pThr/pTyr-binding forkhead associated (FHA) protein
VASLRITSGPLLGERIEVDRELVIGRLDADITIEDEELSRRHLIVRPMHDALEVEDLGSTNGTFVDDSRIGRPTRLRDGATVKLGSTVLVVEGLVVGQTTRVSGNVADLEPTRVSGAILDVQATRVRKAPASGESPAASEPETGAGSRSTATLGSFEPSSSRRGGLASRSWLPVALSFGSVILTAVALVLYFAAR